MTSPNIPISDVAADNAPFRKDLLEAATRVIDSGRYILGTEVEGLERELSTYLGGGHCVGVSSGTDALIIALRALGIGAGHEVITTPWSFAATAEAIVRVGAMPVFADIERDTLNIDPKRVLARLSSKTRAILPVHLFGLPASPGLRALTESHGIALVEDAAQALGAAADDRLVGRLGQAAAFSFFPSKGLGGFGDGGMVVLQDAKVAALARSLRQHGFGADRRQAETLGYNARLDALQAALLRVKLQHLDTLNRGRCAVARRYDEALEANTHVQRFPAPPGVVHAYHQYAIAVPTSERDAILASLNAEGIGARAYYSRLLPDMPPFLEQGDWPQARWAAASVICLPIWARMPGQDQDRVISALLSALNQRGL